MNFLQILLTIFVGFKWLDVESVGENDNGQQKPEKITYPKVDTNTNADDNYLARYGDQLQDLSVIDLFSVPGQSSSHSAAGHISYPDPNPPPPHHPSQNTQPTGGTALYPSVYPQQLAPEHPSSAAVSLYPKLDVGEVYGLVPSVAAGSSSNSYNPSGNQYAQQYPQQSVPLAPECEPHSRLPKYGYWREQHQQSLNNSFTNFADWFCLILPEPNRFYKPLEFACSAGRFVQTLFGLDKAYKHYDGHGKCIEPAPGKFVRLFDNRDWHYFGPNGNSISESTFFLKWDEAKKQFSSYSTINLQASSSAMQAQQHQQPFLNPNQQNQQPPPPETDPYILNGNGQNSLAMLTKPGASHSNVWNIYPLSRAQLFQKKLDQLEMARRIGMAGQWHPELANKLQNWKSDLKSLFKNSQLKSRAEIIQTAFKKALGDKTTILNFLTYEHQQVQYQHEIINIFTSKNYSQLRKIFSLDNRLPNLISMADNGISKFFKVLNCIVKDALNGRSSFFAELLHEKLQKLQKIGDSWLPGYKDAHNDIQRILATRAQIDLEDIVSEYNQRFGPLVGVLEGMRRNLNWNKDYYTAYLEIIGQIWHG